MKKLTLKFVMIAVILFSVTNMFGQKKNDTIKLKLFGLGLHMEQFRLGDMSLSLTTTPANKIMLILTPVKCLRVEPEFGYTTFKDKTNDLKDMGIEAGIGILGMYQRGKVNIYAGARLEYLDFSHDYLTNNDVKKTEKIKITTIGPVVGVEYFFARYFSIGGEVGVNYFTSKDTDNQFSEDVDEDGIRTESGLILRFYF